MLILRPRLRKGKWLAHSHTVVSGIKIQTHAPVFPETAQMGWGSPSLLIESLGKRTTISSHQALWQKCHTGLSTCYSSWGNGSSDLPKVMVGRLQGLGWMAVFSLFHLPSPTGTMPIYPGTSSAQPRTWHPGVKEWMNEWASTRGVPGLGYTPALGPLCRLLVPVLCWPTCPGWVTSHLCSWPQMTLNASDWGPNPSFLSGLSQPWLPPSIFSPQLEGRG